VFESRGCDLAIRHVKRASHKLPLPIQSAPTARRRFEFRSPPPWRPQDDSFTQLSETDGAHEQRIKLCEATQVLTLGSGWGRTQFRRNVDVQQETAHSKSTGRLKDGVRLKSLSTSSSASKPRTLAHASINS
jgi:hypothetical protein